MKPGDDITPLAGGTEIILTCLRMGLQGYPMSIHSGPKGLTIKLGRTKIAHGKDLRALRKSWEAWRAENG